MSRSIFERKGAFTTYHRESGGSLCPCVTPEGFRDPTWHLEHPSEPVCNASGYLTVAIEFLVKAFVQPIYGSRRLSSLNQNLLEVFGAFQLDDHIGMFPNTWEGHTIDFDNWSQSGDEWIEFNGKRFIVIGWVPIPDPHNSQNVHHLEVSLRRITS